MAVDKVKFSITSDGTSEGTKIVLNGENITENKKLVDASFYASAATAYPNCHCIGTCSCGCEMKQYPEAIEFAYTAYDKNDKGEKIYTRYKFCLSKNSWEPIITPLGKPTPTEEGGYIEDAQRLLGRELPLIKDILSYKDKTKRFIPDKDVLRTRSIDSLIDMLEDLKKEV